MVTVLYSQAGQTEEMDFGGNVGRRNPKAIRGVEINRSFHRLWATQEARLTPRGTMTDKNLVQIDRESLVKLLEAFVDTSEVLQRQLMLYQTLFAAACKTAGLNQSETQIAVERGREQMAPKISAACRGQYLDLLAKLPRIVELLASDQDAALRFLKEWTPKGPPN
jgi:hypothetical protein